MTNDDQKRQQWAEEGDSFLLTLLLADQMAKANNRNRSAAIRKTARKIRDESTDPFFKERMCKIIKLNDRQLVEMMPGLWNVCMHSEHFDSAKERDSGDLHIFAKKRPKLHLNVA